MNRSLLKQVLSLPTAPFHEERVVDFICRFCRDLSLRVHKDIYGNLKVIYKKGKAGPIAFAAHMDHPGFEVIRSRKKRATVRLLGGVPDRYFLGAKVLVVQYGMLVKGKVVQRLSKKRREFLVQTAKPVAKGSFGYFDITAVKFAREFIYTKAADNLMSVALLLNLLEVLVKKKVKAHVVCLFTRAEEVGLLGAFGLARRRFLPTAIPVVVMETSSAKAGRVEMGRGPVLRVGDRFASFSFELDLWLRETAEKLKQKKRKFLYQRALLPGGMCEASIYILTGYCVGGLALPLGHYHNAGPKGYAAEYIHGKDYQNMLTWLLALAQSPPQKESLKRIAGKFEKHFKQSAPRLTRKVSLLSGQKK